MAAGLLLQLGYAAYTGRHVSPADFGSYAVALSLSFPVSAVTHGLVQLTLTSQRSVSIHPLSTVRLPLVSGLLLFAVSQALAPFWARMFDAPHLLELLRCLAFHGLLSPFAVVCTTLLRTRRENRAAALLELGGQVLGLVAGAALLAVGWNPMGLAAMWPVANVVPAVGGALLLRSTAVPEDAALAADTCDRGPNRELRDCLQYAIVHVLTVCLAIWAASWALGAVVTGHYSRAYYFAAMLAGVLNSAIVRIAVPDLTRAEEDGSSFDRVLLDVLCLASALGALFLGMCGAFGPVVLPLLLGSTWEISGSMIPWFMPGFATLLLCTVGYGADRVRNMMPWVFCVQWVVAAAVALVVAVSVALRSPQLLALSTAFATAAGHVVQLRRWHRDRVVNVPRLLHAYAVHLGMGLIVFLAGSMGGILADGPAAMAAVLCAILPVLLAAWVCRSFIPALQISMARAPSKAGFAVSVVSETAPRPEAAGRGKQSERHL